jgi:DNA gyrase subunit A
MYTENDTIDPINIEEEMKRSYIDYSMSVIIGRALPDARDGLKPVHRRVLFAMRELANTHNRPYKKSARVVGDVIGKYHPHGDTAVYDTIVRMAQDFSLRYPLVDGQGNFGSVDGDPPAAMRYTEVRMQRMAEDMLADLDKETVDYGANYDGSLEEPLILPSKIPCLLLNGSSGIAVGMATNIPPHNLNEICDAVIQLIDDPSSSVDALAAIVQGPDFPTGGVICGTQGIAQMYRTGRGQMRIRGRAGIEEGRNGKDSIVITEIPYIVNKTTLIENIARLVGLKTLEGISDIRDESNNQGMRIVIELKRGAIPKVLINNIYKHTQLQTTFGAIMLAIDNGQPRVMNLVVLLRCFVAHRFEVITRRTKYELNKAEERAHILEGLRIAIDNLDDVVKTIRAASNRDEARTNLMAKFELSERQATAILDMRLYQLTGLERKKLEDEYLEIIKRISYLKDLLANEDKIYDLIKTDMGEIKEQYGDERRTAIEPDANDMVIEDLIADRSSIITVSHRGYIKRVPMETYKAQRRGGKGVAGMGTRDEDFVQHLFIAKTHDYILFFTEDGQVHWEKVYEIPEAGRTSRGKAIVNLLQIATDAQLAAMIKVREFSEDRHLVMATERGVIKKTNLADFSRPRRGGINAINIDKGDRLIGVKETGGEDDIVLATRAGKSIRFAERQLRDLGRATRGVRGIKLGKDDRVVLLEIVEDKTTFLVCTENGYGKRTSFDEYRGQKRGGQGIIAIRTSERNGQVIGAHAVRENDALMLITANGKMIRMAVGDVRVISRVTQGVRLINVDDGDKLVSATPVASEKAPEEEQDMKLGSDQDAPTEEPPADDATAEEDEGADDTSDA